MDTPLKIGLIGLDTSHVEVFTKILQEEDHRFHIDGGNITVAYPGGSDDFELSASRVGKYTDLLEKEYAVDIVNSPKDVAKQCDAVMINSADGRIHLEQFRDIVEYKKPVFIDKPLAIDSKSAQDMVQLAKDYGTPLMSSSALRYDESLTDALENTKAGKIIGADCFGPMQLQPTQPGLFWYGIHSVEMLYTILGTGCEEVAAYKNENHDLLVGKWKDGRFGTVRGNRLGNKQFGSAIHRESGTQTTNSNESQKPFHAYLLEQILHFMKTGKESFQLETTLEIIRFIEASNESREHGKFVKVNR